MTREQEQEALFLREFPRLAGWCGALLGDRDAGLDVAADAFTRLLPRWAKVTDHRGYLYVTAANTIRDRWRRSATRARSAHLLVQAEAAPDIAAAHAVRDAVSRLPARLRVPVLLYFYADMTTGDIAKHLDRPPGTVRRWLAEAHKALALALTEAR